MRMWSKAFGAVCIVAGLGSPFIPAGSPGRIAAADELGRDARHALVARGETLFLKEWSPRAPSRHGGDGLGPVYNDTSCVACHNLGGTGGAGPVSKNVDLLSAVVTPGDNEGGRNSFLSSRLRQRQRTAEMAKRRGEQLPERSPKGAPPDRAPLSTLHAGFRTAPSVVVPRFGTNRDHEQWRIPLLNPSMAFLFDRPMLSPRFAREQTASVGVNRSLAPLPFEHGDFTLIHTQRNPSPLFGAGLIDAIPDIALAIAAATRHPGYPAIQGRLSQLDDGRIGRFGWKAQAATLDDFVLTACAVELGLEVPGHAQALNPRDASYRAPGLDLTRAECDALTAFVRSIPAPTLHRPEHTEDALRVMSGRTTFEAVGCATCHAPELGGVEGIYSDLLLHDMGEQLSDNGAYGSLTPGSNTDEDMSTGIMPNGPLAFQGAKPAFRGPSRREWRTPPLWGLRDSGPYLHDGRAETLEQAIALHGGQAELPKQRYFGLPEPERLALEAFLKSLVAPSTTAPRRDRPQERPRDHAVRLTDRGGEKPGPLR
ncbi:MAG: di-heme oxidoredictase family protein [Isosphaeraceae bacterium]|nr:di-heme oxidoredictase family protein [Isosphaeraceae bacterium]